MSAGKTQPAGRALLIHRGMVSWMETCSVCLEAVKRSDRPATGRQVARQERRRYSTRDLYKKGARKPVDREFQSSIRT